MKKPDWTSITFAIVFGLGGLLVSQAHAGPNCSGRSIERLKITPYKGKTGFAAIASNQNGKGCGYSFGASSRKNAKKTALEYCKYHSKKHTSNIKCVVTDVK